MAWKCFPRYWPFLGNSLRDSKTKHCCFLRFNPEQLLNNQSIYCWFKTPWWSCDVILIVRCHEGTCPWLYFLIPYSVYVYHLHYIGGLWYQKDVSGAYMNCGMWLLNPDLDTCFRHQLSLYVDTDMCEKWYQGRLPQWLYIHVIIECQGPASSHHKTS